MSKNIIMSFRLELEELANQALIDKFPQIQAHTLEIKHGAIKLFYVGPYKAEVVLSFLTELFSYSILVEKD
jgi:hypothetical protein